MHALQKSPWIQILSKILLELLVARSSIEIKLLAAKKLKEIEFEEGDWEELQTVLGILLFLGMDGGMVLVSHDFRLINQVAHEIWVCENQVVTRWEGDTMDFKQHLKATVLVLTRLCKLRKRVISLVVGE
ncbi:hypothetical protein WN943_018811 [Citrus x changshan-huyou]